MKKQAKKEACIANLIQEDNVDNSCLMIIYYLHCCRGMKNMTMKSMMKMKKYIMIMKK